MSALRKVRAAGAELPGRPVAGCAAASSLAAPGCLAGGASRTLHSRGVGAARAVPETGGLQELRGLRRGRRPAPAGQPRGPRGPGGSGSCLGQRQRRTDGPWTAREPPSTSHEAANAGSVLRMRGTAPGGTRATFVSPWHRPHRRRWDRGAAGELHLLQATAASSARGPAPQVASGAGPARRQGRGSGGAEGTPDDGARRCLGSPHLPGPSPRASARRPAPSAPGLLGAQCAGAGGGLRACAGLERGGARGGGGGGGGGGAAGPQRAGPPGRPVRRRRRGAPSVHCARARSPGLTASPADGRAVCPVALRLLNSERPRMSALRKVRAAGGAQAGTPSCRSDRSWAARCGLVPRRRCFPDPALPRRGCGADCSGQTGGLEELRGLRRGRRPAPAGQRRGPRGPGGSGSCLGQRERRTDGPWTAREPPSTSPEAASAGSVLRMRGTAPGGTRATFLSPWHRPRRRAGTVGLRASCTCCRLPPPPAPGDPRHRWHPGRGLRAGRGRGAVGRKDPRTPCLALPGLPALAWPFPTCLRAPAGPQRARPPGRPVRRRRRRAPSVCRAGARWGAWWRRRRRGSGGAEGPPDGRARCCLGSAVRVWPLPRCLRTQAGPQRAGPPGRPVRRRRRGAPSVHCARARSPGLTASPADGRAVCPITLRLLNSEHPRMSALRKVRAAGGARAGTPSCRGDRSWAARGGLVPRRRCFPDPALPRRGCGADCSGQTGGLEELRGLRRGRRPAPAGQRRGPRGPGGSGSCLGQRQRRTDGPWTAREPPATPPEAASVRSVLRGGAPPLGGRALPSLRPGTGCSAALGPCCGQRAARAPGGIRGGDCPPAAGWRRRGACLGSPRLPGPSQVPPRAGWPPARQASGAPSAQAPAGGSERVPGWSAVGRVAVAAAAAPRIVGWRCGWTDGPQSMSPFAC
eukprot:XP_022261612.1 collagen alpha-1(I) chain-like [Canis lupus familiaris]